MRETEGVRLYVPTTLPALADSDGLHPVTAHAVTPGLATALPDEDEEGLELAALLAAADDSVALLSGDPHARRWRVVAVAEVPGRVPTPLPGGVPSAVVPPGRVTWADVVSLHVDEEIAEEDVAAAAAGDPEALERAAGRDLLWFDVTELDVLRDL